MSPYTILLHGAAGIVVGGSHPTTTILAARFPSPLNLLKRSSHYSVLKDAQSENVSLDDRSLASTNFERFRALCSGLFRLV